MTPERTPPPFPDDDPAAAVAVALARLAAAVRQHAWQGAAEAGLTPTQGQLADLLSRRRGATLAELADALGIGAATASEAIAVMVEKGLVEKARAAGDGRRLALRLTARGERSARASAAWPAFLAGAAAALPDADRRALLALLVRLIRELQERGEIPVARMCVTCRFFRPHRHADSLRPHHCAFVDAPFGDGAFRFDCPDHEAAEPAAAAAALERFATVA
jgi:DNA-binding MarR family transcriptional regulator